MMIEELFHELRLLQQARRQRNWFALLGLGLCLGAWALLGIGLATA